MDKIFACEKLPQYNLNTCVYVHTIKQEDVAYNNFKKFVSLYFIMAWYKIYVGELLTWTPTLFFIIIYFAFCKF